MKAAFLGLIGSFALLGASCSCSVSDFAPVALENVSYANSYTIDRPFAAAPADSKTLEEAQYMSALWIGDPQADNYYNGDSFQQVLGLTGVYSGAVFNLWCAPSNNEIWNRIYIAQGKDLIANSGALVNDFFGGDADLLSNRDFVIYFKEPMHLTWIYPGDRSAHFNSDFRVPSVQSGYSAGYDDASALYKSGVFAGARYVTLTYTKDGGSFASVDYPSADSALTAFKPYMFNGLLGVNEWLYNDRGGNLLPDWDGSSDVGLIIQYADVVSITASPLYIDVEVFTDQPAAGLCSTFTPRLSNGTTPMSLTFDRSFKGLVTDYYSYDSRYNVFKGYSFVFPAQSPVCQTNYVGILSNYAAGYLDGVNSRNAEISDLSETIIELQADLSQYQGRSYDEIFNMGKAEGLQSGNNANQVLSGLFGAILSVPMSIFGGLGDMTIVGVSVMSLIASLLLVAVAVVVIKKLL